jgi:hypothetical protein
LSKIQLLFDIEQATKVLNYINKDIAGIFIQEPKPVRFIFLTYIASPAKDKIVLGQCVHSSPLNEIQIRIRQGWQNTAIHELVHLYNPGASETRVKEITRDTIRYLKAVNL